MTTARRLALDLLVRIDTDGAYANLLVNRALDTSDLEDRDRRFVTDLVYGTTRMRRACDHLVDRHLKGSVSARVRSTLRMGAYQLAFTETPTHAAVSATVDVAPPTAASGLVNAVLRRVGEDVATGVAWPDEATRLSVPDWIVVALSERLGPAAAIEAIGAMNLPATTHTRDDGYVQDPASQAVVEIVGGAPGMRVLDVCAAPGGKATAIRQTGAWVLAADFSIPRSSLIVANARALDADVPVTVADGRALPFRAQVFDRVLVDAPCSGLGVLRRRPDARWRIEESALPRLGALQTSLLDAAAGAVCPGGELVYSVCTLTKAENADVIESVRLPKSFSLAEERTIPPSDDTDGMYVARWRRRVGSSVTGTAS